MWAVGDDANIPLLTMLARNPAGNPGFVEAIRSTEPAEFPLRLFLSKVTRKPVEGLNLAASPSPNFTLIYPLEETRFPGSLASWIGQYQQPGPATFTAGPFQGATTLPATSADHPQLPRTWAVARVKALLEKIERDGEDRRFDRRNHSSLAQIQICDAVHLFPGRAARLVAAAPDPSRRPGAARTRPIPRWLQ